MKYRIIHKTTYRYSEPASLSQNELFLHPREIDTQRVLESILSIVPKPQYIHRRKDYFGNIAHVFMVQQPHNTLTMTATSVVETTLPSIPTAATTPPWETAVRRLSAPVRQSTDLEACQFIFASPMITVNSKIMEYAQLSFPPGIPILEGAMDLM